jgi:flagellar FliJ protein
MKKFKYKLDQLLKIRKFQEKREFANYAVVLGRVNKLQADIIASAGHHKDLMHIERGNMLRGKFDFNDMLLAQEYKKKLNLIKDASLKKIESMKSEFESLRNKAEDARKNRRILEILREKKHQVYEKELEKNEFKQIDEFNQRKKKEF